MLNAQKVSGLYKMASSQKNQHTSRRLDRYDSDSPERTEDYSSKNFKDILQQEFTKKARDQHNL